MSKHATVKIKCPACGAYPVPLVTGGPLIGSVLRHQRNERPQWYCQGGGQTVENLFQAILIQKIEAAKAALTPPTTPPDAGDQDV